MSDEHESPIKTPKQLITAVVLAFVVPILVIALLVKYVNLEKRVGAGAEAMTQQAVAARIAPVAGPGSAAGYSLKDPSAPKVLRGGEEVYKGQCAGCHATGAAGAPKFGDNGAWAPRIKTGFEALWNSALKGKGAMTAQSGGEYDDAEIANAVVYMANGSGGKLEAPKGAAPVVAAVAPATAAPAAAATAPAAVSMPAKVYFESGKAGLDADGNKAIAAAVDFLKGNATAAVDLTGFTDKKGNLAQNMELAKERAKAVRAALEAAGVAKERVNMKPPESVVADGADKEARRVDIKVSAAK
jgi:cytochrome c5